MKSWIYLGAEVICVDETPPKEAWSGPPLSSGKVYTIAEIGPGEPVHLGFVGLPKWHDGSCWLYAYWRFRPLITDESRATIAALKQAMRDHVANASGGAGIKRGVRV